MMDKLLNATGPEFCEQCDAFCFACAIGRSHMNIAKPGPENTFETTPEFNAKGHHHVMWAGAENELVPCGSDRANELARRAQLEARKEKDRPSNTRQVAGTHYGLSSFQHWDIVAQFDLDYFQGQITKYVMRWDKKNGVVDLEKAQHFLEKYIEEIKAGRIVKGPSKAAN